MRDNEIQRIADSADMIVAGYSYTTDKNGNVRVLDLEHPDRAAVLQPDGDTVIQNRGTVSDKDMRTIQKYIKTNYLTMFEMWPQYSEHGFYCENV